MPGRRRGAAIARRASSTADSQAAVALGMPLDEAARLLEEARRDLGLDGDKNLI